MEHGSMVCPSLISLPASMLVLAEHRNERAGAMPAVRPVTLHRKHSFLREVFDTSALSVSIVGIPTSSLV